ncbi:MAG: AbrB/MazE/SpoVT family DNA-binding domain-containing protein [Clostridiales bacterium]|nr:AbrB/MazE/SpoVT family DNA-binding domain-containing protein [Clostridiales bacterium]
MLAEYRARSQITLPKAIALKIGLSVGDMLDVVVKDGGVFLRPVMIVQKETQDVSAKTEKGKRELLQNLYGSINDPTFVEPTEIPWEFSAPREEIV